MFGDGVVSLVATWPGSASAALGSPAVRRAITADGDKQRAKGLGWGGGGGRGGGDHYPRRNTPGGGRERGGLWESGGQQAPRDQGGRGGNRDFAASASRDATQTPWVELRRQVFRRCQGRAGAAVQAGAWRAAGRGRGGAGGPREWCVGAQGGGRPGARGPAGPSRPQLHSPHSLGELERAHGLAEILRPRGDLRGAALVGGPGWAAPGMQTTLPRGRGRLAPPAAAAQRWRRGPVRAVAGA